MRLLPFILFVSLSSAVLLSGDAVSATRVSVNVNVDGRGHSHGNSLYSPQLGSAESALALPEGPVIDHSSAHEIERQQEIERDALLERSSHLTNKNTIAQLRESILREKQNKREKAAQESEKEFLGERVKQYNVVDAVKEMRRVANGKKVVTFIGFSGAEYERPEAMLHKAKEILSQMDPKTHVVNIGGTPEGIGKVYQLAKEMGFMTTGIVSTQSLKYGTPTFDNVDKVALIEDPTWGGKNEQTGHLNPTSEAMVESSDIVIGLGGGDVGRDEILASKAMGKHVEYYSFEMNHQKAIKKATDKGQPAPTNFHGSVDSVIHTNGILH